MNQGERDERPIRGQFDLIVLAEEPETIKRGDISRISTVIRSLLISDHQSAKNYQGKVAFSIDGYHDDPRELYQIEEVRSWFAKLDEAFPYLLYFLSEQANMLLLYVAMLVPFELKEGGLLFQTEPLVAFIQEKGLAIINLCQLIGDNPAPIVTRIGAKFGLLS